MLTPELTNSGLASKLEQGSPEAATPLPVYVGAGDANSLVSTLALKCFIH